MRAIATRSSGLGNKPVADARFGDEVIRIGRILFELLAQMPHVDADVMAVLRMGGAPHGLEQLSMRQHAVGVGDHVGQQAEFDGRQVERLSVLFDHASPQVNPDRSEFHHAGSVRSGPMAPAQMGAYAGQEFCRSEGLCKVIVGAGVEGRDLFGFHGSRRQNDDRNLRPGAQLPDQVDAVAIRQA